MPIVDTVFRIRIYCGSIAHLTNLADSFAGDGAEDTGLSVSRHEK
jgi:hypothetical protein